MEKIKDSLARFSIEVAGWVLCAEKTKIAEQSWHASANLIKGHPLHVVFKRAVASLRSKSEK